MAKKPHSIRDILVKQIARDLRRRYPHLRVEGHPAEVILSIVTKMPKLLVADGKDSVTFTFSPSASLLTGYGFVGPQFVCNDNCLVVIGIVTENGNRHSNPKRQVFDLVQPDSIQKLETWLTTVIEEYI